LKKLEEFKINPMFPMAPVSDVQISPHGDEVLFTYTEESLEKDKRTSHIWKQSLSNGKPRQFTYCNGNDSCPRWSPDGRIISFLSDRRSGDEKDGDEKGEKKPKRQLWSLNADGGEARSLTSVNGGVENPVWSPDGRFILFTSSVLKREDEERDDVKVIMRIKYRFDGRGYFPGKWIHLYSVPPEGGEATQLTDGEYDVVATAVSPDGRRVAFTCNMDEHADISFFRNIYIIRSEGGEPELFLEGEKTRIGGLSCLAWSPDGRHLAFEGRVIEDTSNIGYRNNEVWIIPLEGGEPRNLTGQLDRTIYTREAGLKWSPDSRHIYFTVPDRGSTNINRVDLNGNVEPVTRGRISVGGYSLGQSGSTIAFNATDAMNPFEALIQRNGETKKITKMTKDVVGRHWIGEPEEFCFTSSVGIKLQGWVMKPKDYEADHKYPTVLMIHGGPSGMYGYSLTSLDGHILGTYGYAVVYMNPTGSVGFGEDFAAGVFGHWGERDYMDIMEAVDYVVENYSFIDPSRLGVMGSSYGGYMTNWLVGHTNRFKAAVAMNSMSNLYSGTGTSDIDYMDHSVTAGKNPWEDVEYFMSKSPISYVENVVTPLLLIHSSEDYRCPIDNAEQLFTALKKLRKTTEFVIFPGSHGFGMIGKPKHRVQRLQHILRWFDRYL
jgi:dipeptidyl aminopeptidase/acylaminoacyl peptidase